MAPESKYFQILLDKNSKLTQQAMRFRKYSGYLPEFEVPINKDVGDVTDDAPMMLTKPLYDEHARAHERNVRNEHGCRGSVKDLVEVDLPHKGKTLVPRAVRTSLKRYGKW